jgi:hypothetical protein
VKLASLFITLAVLPACCFATSSTLHKLHDISIYANPTFHCAFPSVVLRPDGELLCAFRRAPSRKFLYGAPHDTHTDPNSQLVLVRSHDHGETWTTTPELIYAHPLGGSQDPCMIQLRDGTIVCTSYGWAQLPLNDSEGSAALTHEKYRFMGGYVLRSTDGAKTWTGPLLPPDIRDGVTTDIAPLPAFNRGAPVQSAGGELLWAVVKQSIAPGSRPPSVHLLASSDAGETWQLRGVVAADSKIGFNETSVVQTAAGDVIAFLRTENMGGRAAVARSTDGGRTFAPFQDLGFTAEPLQAIRLRDNRILLVYGYRKKPYGVRARLVNPDASDAATAPEFIIRDDGGATDLGYPWAMQLEDDTILVAYYFNIADGPRHIAATKLALH